MHINKQELHLKEIYKLFNNKYYYDNKLKSETYDFKFEQNNKFNKYEIIKSSVPFPHHPYHIVDQSPWPIALSGVLLALTTSAVLTFHGFPMGMYLLASSFLLLNWGMGLWFKDIITEATYLGAHTDKVQKGISLGIVLFIVSEVFFFLSIFWAYFHSALAPAVEIGSDWPPKGIEPLDALEVPTANTTILLSSGSSITVSHHSVVWRILTWANDGSLGTFFLACFFTALQGLEYNGLSYTFADGVFGSTFFMATGFHGLHVIIGTIFLAVGAIRIFAYQLTNTHHVGLESGILYWHFVDIVWLLLYSIVYYWGGQGRSEKPIYDGALTSLPQG